jgi:hypothetical protein
MKSVFVASSRKYYDQVKEIKKRLDELGVKGYYPYFEYVDDQIEVDVETKKQLTLRHFPEIDEIDVLYAVTPNGYVGCSVTIEATYAYAKGKEVVTSEPAAELAVRAFVSSVMTPEEFIAYVSE